MALKLKPPYVDNTVPVYKVPMENGVYGKANNERHSNAGFNISVNQNINDTPTFFKGVEHEMHHIDQMDRGDMDYDDNYVYWKGQKIPRANMPEGAHDLPWEEEVYEEGASEEEDESSLVEDDEMTAEEEGFIRGYNEADEVDEAKEEEIE